MGNNKSSRIHPPYKTKYRVGNWREYEAGLRARGDITVWFTPEAITSWTPPNNGRRGAQRRYSDLAIEASMTLRLLFHLPLRQTEGFLGRYKRIFGGHLRARGPEAQAVEVRLACKVLNRMLELGAPRSYAIGR